MRNKWVFLVIVLYLKQQYVTFKIGICNYKQLVLNSNNISLLAWVFDVWTPDDGHHHNTVITHWTFFHVSGSGMTTCHNDDGISHLSLKDLKPDMFQQLFT